MPFAPFAVSTTSAAPSVSMAVSTAVPAAALAAAPAAPIATISPYQSLNIRYEVSTRTGKLLNLYREGRGISGYSTIEQFFADMAADGWQVDSTCRARSCSLHFAVMKRALK